MVWPFAKTNSGEDGKHNALETNDRLDKKGTKQGGRIRFRMIHGTGEV